MALTSAFFTSSFGTVIVRTSFSMLTLTLFVLAFFGNLNLQRNFPLLLSTRCHLSFFSFCSLLLSPLIWRTLSSSTSTFTSSFFILGRSVLKTWASSVSFQSIRLLAKTKVSPTVLGMLEREVLNGKRSKGSHRSRKKGSKILLRRPPPRTLGMSNIFYGCWIDLLSWTQTCNNFLMIKLMEMTYYILDMIENCVTFSTFSRYFLFG